ncbi:hypothetical protein NM688_g2577 [Phlebia brevispora]|uniref:Uncharacterized protein n=1 Tax=Phlebia brevispora TaxID=194682 RepID=A0ACC1T833_9APHY|nr:hypothetical protein NM688_g2577 [Phlebia brevispora]
MSAKPPSYSNPDPHAAAIVGLSISAPGGEDRGLDTEAFYEFLKARGSGIITVPADRWNADAFHGTAPGQICTTKGGFIPELFVGDPQEFGITPAESGQMLSSQVVLLHQAFNALQRSGVDYRGTNTGVFVGCAGGGTPVETDITQAGPYYMTGTSLSITANRISYVFDLLGQSMPVDTACSSALTAMHLAIQAIRHGECDQAVVAGFSFINKPLETVAFSQLGVLSPDGISRSFDEDANGYARGDVASAVVIKRHDLAVRDRDWIYATLVGSALTSCGSVMGSLTTPSPEAQAQAIRNAYRDAGLKPFQADFVELHGTGTVVGDSLEANAAGAVFSEEREGREILIGSVKSNVGHGEMGCSAYMTSLVKVVMMLVRKQVLPNGHFNKPSTKIEFSKYRLRVPTALEDFAPQDPEQGLIASISSYGFGGSCGHTVLREHELRPVHSDQDTLAHGPFLFAVGALTPKSVQTLIQRYKDDYTNVNPLALCEQLGSRARQMPWRTYAVSNSISTATFSDPVMVEKRPPPIVFCFSGQGPQHWQQGWDLMRTYSVFRESILVCDRAHQEYTGVSYLEETGLFLSDAPGNSRLATSLLWPVDVASVAITFFQIAVFDLLMSFGIKPDAIVGHSLGETAVLYASGAMPREVRTIYALQLTYVRLITCFSVQMVVKIAVARGRVMAEVDNTGGAMIAISGCDEQTVRDHIGAASFLSVQNGTGSMDLHLATFNSPTDIGVSGLETHVDTLKSYVETWVDGVAARKLRVSVAVHSPFVDPCEKTFRVKLASIFAQYTGPFIPTITTMSTVTAKFKTDEYTMDYLWDNLRQPVRFSSAIPSLMDTYGPYTTFVEISPHPVLSQFIKDMGAIDSLPVATRPPSARQLNMGARLTSENETLLRTIGQLVLYGVNSVNFPVLSGCPAERFEGPDYPFQLKVIPFAPPVPSYLNRLLPPTRALNSTRLYVSPHLPEMWMSHHVINHTNLIPAAAYVEMALEFPGVTQVWDCYFEAACILEESAPPLILDVAKDGIYWSVKSSSALQNIQGDLEWTRSEAPFDTTHAHGKLGYGKPRLNSQSITKVDVDAILARCLQTKYQDDIYAESEGLVQFGDEFKRLMKASVNETEAICWIRGHVDEMNRTAYQFHPALMDATFQTAFTWNMLYEKTNVSNKDHAFLLPYSLRHGYRIDGLYEPLVLPEEFRTYSVLREWSPQHWNLDIHVLADDGTVLFTFEGFCYKRVRQDEQWPSQRYTMYWQPRTVPQTALEGHVLLEGLPAHAVDFLASLDQLALMYTKETLSSLPGSFTVASPDRQRYLAWAQTLLSGQHSLNPPVPQSADQDGFSALLELTERVGKGQKEILTSSTAAVELLFRDDLMNKVYEQPPFSGPVFDMFTKEILIIIKHAALAGKRVVRVLEIGAGTGKLTALLGKALIEDDVDKLCFVDYVSTDIAIHLAQQSASRSPWPTVTSMTLDLNSPFDGQGLDPTSFDIIVGFDVLHAIPDVQGVLKKLKDLLLPGGYLAIIELDGRSFAQHGVGTIWMDFIFGSFAEWMGVLNERPEAKHCSLVPDHWKAELDQAGFQDTHLFTQSPTSVSHMAFISQSPPSSCFPSPTPSASSLQSSEPHTPPQPWAQSRIDVISSASMHRLPDDSTKIPGPIQLSSLQLKDSIIEVSSSAVSAASLPNGLSTLMHHFSPGGEIELVRLLSSLDSNVPHRIWLYSTAEPSSSALLGIARTIRHEFGLWRVMMVCFHPSWDLPRQQAFIWDDLMPLPWIEPEILVDQEGNMRVPRVIPAPPAPQLESRIDKPVNFGNLQIWRAYPPDLGAQDVEIKVSYMVASPAFPDCSEFSGKVTSVGPEVTDATLVGQSVFGIAPVTTGSVVVCRRSQVEVIPAGMLEPVAASMAGPLAFLSSVVIRAIASTCNKPRVLLHLGHCPAPAIATYIYLRSLPLEVIVTSNHPSSVHFVSDTVTFAEPQVPMYPSKPCDAWSFFVRQSNARPVDISFNFDSDPDIARETTQLLSSRGTLVQIGSKLPSGLRGGCQYISVDYRSILDEDDLMHSALDRIDPSIRALITRPTKTFSLSKLSDAYEQSNAAVPGSSTILFDLQDTDPNLPILRGGILPNTAAFDPRASYVIIGGVGGLGANIANILIENGARHVVLTSRSGEKAFTPGRLVHEKKIISHLRGIPGVTVDVLAVNCLDVDRTKALFSQSQRRIAGVFYVAVQLNDQLFTNLTTEQDWKAVSNVKVEGLNVLLQAVDPKDLDFLVLTSSMATVTGSPGQANYTGAQTEMEAMGALLSNTISVAVPPITDGGIFVRSMSAGNVRNAALDKYTSLGMTARRVAQHCVDAIWSLGLDPAERYSLYIPPMDWKEVMELSSPEYNHSIRHLVVKEVQEAQGKAVTDERSIRAVCAAVLSLEVNGVEENIPLSSYGLDSLTSVRLSGILKQKFDINVTQLQLLSRHMTVERLGAMREEQRLATKATQGADDSVAGEQHKDQTTLDDADQTVVSLNSATEGKPLLIFHGAGGGILVLRKMAQTLRFPVYGVQDTQEAPITGTLYRLAEFYLSKIKEKQPKGPYRIAGFSFGTCLALVAAQVLQAAGETVEVVVMLEGAPALFARQEFVDSTTRKILDGTLRYEIMSLVDDMVSSGTLDNAVDISQQFAAHFEQVQAGGSGAKWVARFCKAYVAHMLMGLRMGEGDTTWRKDHSTLKEKVWPSARTIFVRAKDGLFAQSASEEASAWFDPDLWRSDVEIHELPGTHFGVLNPHSGLADILNEVL